MFVGSHMVLVSQNGLPTVVNMSSHDYPAFLQAGYTAATEEPMSKAEAEELKQQLLSDITDTE